MASKDWMRKNGQQIIIMNKYEQLFPWPKIWWMLSLSYGLVAQPLVWPSGVSSGMSSSPKRSRESGARCVEVSSPWAMFKKQHWLHQDQWKLRSKNDCGQNLAKFNFKNIQIEQWCMINVNRRVSAHHMFPKTTPPQRPWIAQNAQSFWPARPRIG